MADKSPFPHIIEWELVYVTLCENPYVKKKRKSLHPKHGKYCCCGRCDRYGYIIKPDEEILTTESHIQQWKEDLLEKIRIAHFSMIQKAQRIALHVKEKTEETTGLDAWC